MTASPLKLRTQDIAPREGEMVKPAEIIGLAGLEDWSLADRRTWNVLLLNAWGDRLEDPKADFTIALSELRGLHDSNDRVRSSLEKLQKTLVHATFPDGTKRTVQMLGATDINNEDRPEGLLTYDFHRKLVPLLRCSEIYARMEMKVLNAFTSKYALALYEAIAARVNLRKGSEDIPVAILRQWLGVPTGKLDRWPDLNRFAVQPAVREVNGLSPFSVEIEPLPRGRKVERVRVTWSRKAPFSPEEQAAAREANRPRVGRGARLNGTAESVVRDLTEAEIQKGFDAAAPVCRLDKRAAYADWRAMVSGFAEPPANPVGHFIDFCKKRAQESA